MGRKPKDLVQLTLRLREDLRREIERAAKRGNRSLNDEVVRRLETFAKAYAEADAAYQGERERLTKAYAAWQEERERLIKACDAAREDRELIMIALRTDLSSHPNPIFTKAALTNAQDNADRDVFEDVFLPEGDKS